MFMKSLIAVAALATVAGAAAAPANAKVNVYLGVGGFGPGYYEPAYPVYQPHHYRPYYDEVYVQPHHNYGVSCQDGAEAVRDSGFYKVRAVDCGGKRLKYRARRDGDSYIVSVSRRSGDVVSVQQAW